MPTASDQQAEAIRLHDSVTGLRVAVQAEAAGILERWAPAIAREEFRASAGN